MPFSNMSRKRVGAPLYREFKKRRSSYSSSTKPVRRANRYLSTSSRDNVTFTSRASSANDVGTFRGRKMSLRNYRNMLWRDSAMKPHYRSVFDAVGTITTPLSNGTATLQLLNAMPPSFWIAGNGTKALDTGVAVPTFSGDIILRGGIARISLANRVGAAGNANDAIRCTVFAVWTRQNPNAITAPTGVVETLWDPSVFPDFDRIGKVLFKRTAILKGDGEALEVFFKYKVQKIDQAIYNQAGALRGNALVWMIHISQMSDADAVTETIELCISHNVSFSADAQ